MPPKRTDSNQREVVQAFRELGATVRSIHTVGDGVPDLIVGVHGQTILVEVKDGAKSPSKRRLTPAEQKFHDEWRGGELLIVETVADVMRAVADARNSWR